MTQKSDDERLYFKSNLDGKTKRKKEGEKNWKVENEWQEERQYSWLFEQSLIGLGHSMT